ncbi:MAG: nuclease-related domain-containing protein [Paeniclostridium sordellii]|uniref:NERD domain-containing protein n=1 Tax=Paeniclostridium hominis TaxID=2764329 RepID=A0ABR7K4K7_9FIRM|nr:MULTISPECIES: nuclease-related domain-containing protein [Paeniclostridium]MBC6004044.1 NERD domain-containing protein [Paeniclostridium hominis]MDU1538724.1 nuclease-related domain-containing protein [Paeniclostridium sordellii]MDU2592077.1 nuclease-related domain-containing protein [Paeniclostridium sordellii]
MKDKYLIIISIIISITYVYFIESSKKDKLKRIIESNSKGLNDKNASVLKILESYEYECGKKYKSIKHDKGQLFEYNIFEIIYRLGGKVLTDLYVRKENNQDTQIDIVFIHNTGIYVFEVKNLSAKLIKGDDEDERWILYYRENVKNIYSPLKQNINHVKAIKNFLSDKYDFIQNYYSIVVMNTQKNKIKVNYEIEADGFRQMVLSKAQLKEQMENFIKEIECELVLKDKLLSDEEILEVYNYLHDECSNVDEDRKNRHLKAVKSI